MTSVPSVVLLRPQSDFCWLLCIAVLLVLYPQRPLAAAGSSVFGLRIDSEATGTFVWLEMQDLLRETAVLF